MGDVTIKEGIEILKNLSPKNQAYFMTMLRLAEVAEAGARREVDKDQTKSEKVV